MTPNPIILRLPPEILSYIFRQCINNWATQLENLPDDWKKRVDDSYWWKSSPRCIIIQVCRTWRDSLLSDSDLWRDIDISEYLRPSGHMQLERDLALSNNLLLRIFHSRYSTIYYVYRRLGQDTLFGQDKFPQVFDLLGQTRHRWVSVHRGIKLDHFYEFLEQPGPSPKFPALKSLHVSRGDSDGKIVTEVDAPCLVDIALNCRNFGVQLLPLSAFPWSNLHRAQIAFTTAPSMERILPRLTSVAHLELKIDTSCHEPPYPSGPIELPLVNTLKIYSINNAYNRARFSSDYNPMHIVSRLRLPGLKTLLISEIWEVKPIESMLQATQFPLSPQDGVQTLELSLIEEPDGPIAEFRALFHHLPNLKSLLLAYSGPEENIQTILDSLAPSPDLRDVLCPVLEHLIIPTAHMHAQDLEMFITARLGYESTVTRLEIDCFCFVPEPGGREFVEGLVSALQAFVLHPGRTLQSNILVPISLNCDDLYTLHRIYCYHGSRSVEFVGGLGR